MQRIDLRDVLQRAVSDGYGDLVTRSTGQAVRAHIERALASWDGDIPTVIDFGTVRCLDLSCADEIVAKLLLQSGPDQTFVLAGVTDAHRDALQPVLERHHLAVVSVDPTGRLDVLGALPEFARRAFTVVAEAGPMDAGTMAARLGVEDTEAHAALQQLVTYRLIEESVGGYRPLFAA